MQYIRYPEVRRLTGGMGRTTVWRLEKAGRFPSRRQISPGSVAWLKDEVDAWISSRPLAAAGVERHVSEAP